MAPKIRLKYIKSSPMFKVTFEDKEEIRKSEDTKNKNPNKTK
jgi:hypothetical protein